MAQEAGSLAYDFMSPAWLAALHGVISERVAQATRNGEDISFSVCEVALDPPAHLSPMGESLGWCCNVVSGRVTFTHRAGDDVDLKVEGDYRALASLATIVVGDDPSAAERLRKAGEALVASGRVRVRGDARRPESIGSFHDAIARLTATG